MAYSTRLIMRIYFEYILLIIVPVLTISLELNKQYDLLQDETTMSFELLITEYELPLMKDFLIIDITTETFPASSITVYTVRGLLR